MNRNFIRALLMMVGACATNDNTTGSATTAATAVDDVPYLREAIADEYKAEATYQAVIAEFGEVRPFSNIVHAERRHASATRCCV